VRLFPTKNQEETLRLMIDQQRWYYNAIVNIMSTKYNKETLYLEKKKTNNPEEYETHKWSPVAIRTILEQHQYVEEIQNIEGKETVVKSFVTRPEGEKGVPVPYSIQTGQPWWDSLHSRIPRGAVAKYTSSLNSGITNLREKNIAKHQMKYQSRKKLIEYLHFDDEGFPRIISQIYSKYWYRVPRSQTIRKYEKTGTRKMRACLSLSEIMTQTGKNGLEVIYDKVEKKYYVHYPVDEKWYPTNDFRNENQVETEVKGDTIISLDPGVRKFLVGYDPKGKSVFFGEEVQEKLIEKLLEIDQGQANRSEEWHMKWKRIKNLVSEMHWKSIRYLVKNYDTIMYPDYRVSQMLKKDKLGKMTKRLMTMYRSYEFRQRLEYQCKKNKRELIIVDESYTSCTCGKCGKKHENLRGNKVFECPSCGVCMDRDASGSRNILLKHLQLKENSIQEENKEEEVTTKKRVVRKPRTKSESLSEENKVKRQTKRKSERESNE
jgi:transposase